MLQELKTLLITFIVHIRNTVFNLRTVTALFYFILAIVIFASVGVYVPYVFESIKHVDHNLQDLKQNIITYYVAIFASASLDLFLKVIDKDTSAKKAQVMGLIIFSLILGGGTAYLLYINAYSSQPHIFWWLISAILISYLMWGVAHFKDDAFSPATTLGGNTNKTLSNG